MEEGGEFLNGVIREYGKNIAYVHFRNVVGTLHGIPEISDPEGYGLQRFQQEWFWSRESAELQRGIHR